MGTEGEGVSIQQIVNALLRWRGKVKPAAEELGMRRNSLYERIERAHLDLAAFRSADRVAAFTGVSGMSGVPGSMPGRPDMAGSDRGAVRVPKNETAPYRGSARGPIVSGVVEAATAVDEVPIPTLPARSKIIRVEPENQDRLRDAKRRLCAVFNVESDETLLLNQFIKEQLEPWVQKLEKAGLARAAAGTKKVKDAK